MADDQPTPQDSADYQKAMAPPRVLQYFDTDQITLTSTTVPKKILSLAGGQAVLLKALVGNSGNIYFGKSNVVSTKGFELTAGESIKIEYLPDKNQEQYIDLYFIPATANDKVCFLFVP